MLTDFLRVISEFGFLGLFVIFATVVIFKYISARIDLWVSYKKKSDNDIALQNDAELKYHPFFSNAQYRLMVEIPNLEFDPSRPVRQNLFRNLLLIRIKLIHDTCYDFIKEDMTDWSADQWINEVLRLVTETNIRFDSVARKEGIPDLVIEKFMRSNIESTEVLNDYVNALGTSSIYVTNTARTNTFLIIMNLLLVTTLGDAERTLNSLNGELSGLEYKNLIVE